MRQPGIETIVQVELDPAVVRYGPDDIARRECRRAGRSLLYGLVIGVLAGMASGTAGAPVLGTIIGAFVGLAIAVPVSLVVAGAIAISARPPVTAKAYRRRVDVTLVILAVGAAAIAAVWINQRALFGPWPALAMLATVVLCLIAVRPLLRRLVPSQATSSA